uniref:Uncharacterized protein n=1 Tax=Meloidogyne hapla TaxID=6305 RepID=A0A1I8C0R7_MELHA
MDDQKCQNPSTSNLIDQQQLNNNNLIIKTNKDLINCFNKNSPEKQQNNENNKELFGVII